MTLNDSVHYVMFPGAGSAGLTWEAIARELDALVLPLGDEPDVASIAQAQLPRVEELARPRVLVGASLGAMVAIEVARRTAVDAMVLMAAGFGVHVSESAIQWVQSNPPGLMDKMAQLGIGEPGNESLVSLRRKDFEARGGQPVLLRQLQILEAYRPQPLEDPPFTVVLWGPLDRSVPLADHAELAMRMNGLLVPVDGSGHAPFLERPQQTVAWIKRALVIAEHRDGES